MYKRQPWLSKCEVGEQFTVAISHVKGRLVAPQEVLDTLMKNGQIATQYVDIEGNPTMDQSYNPNGSVPVSYTHLDVYKRQLLN